MVHFSV